MTGDSGNPAIPYVSERSWRRLPKRFFLGTLLLYATVMGTYALVLTPLQYEIPSWRTIVPFLAFGAFYISAGLFLLILGRGHVSRWAVLTSVIATFFVACLLTVSLRADRLYRAIDPVRVGTRAFVASVASAVEWINRNDGAVADMLKFTGTILVEEAVKLLPVFLLIAMRKIRTAHGAMLCGALAGLTFGVVEAVTYGYLEYPVRNEPVTTYLTRFLVMAPLHGIWDALAGGLVFFLSGRWRSSNSRRPELTAYLAAFACAAVFHIAHNALQLVIGPAMQILSVFALLAPLYYMSRSARKRSEAMGQPQELPFIGDLHLLVLSMATLFLSSSMLFYLAMGLIPQPAL